MTIVTMWIKDNVVNAAFSDNGQLYSKDCGSKDEAEKQFDTIKDMLSKKGHVIKLKEKKD